MNYDKSKALFQKATQLMPGGVNSPVRAFRSVGMDPPFICRGNGARIYDEDGHEYIDYVCSWGPLILGHAYPAVIESIQQQAALGTSFGAVTRLEVDMAEMITQAVPSVEMVRMVNSGTEATMSAIRLARGYTGRDKVIKFAGCYHGHADALLIKAGSGAMTFGVPDSQGVSPAITSDTIVTAYNDAEALDHVFEQWGRDIAAVIFEPVAGNMGTVPPQMDFLREIEYLCGKYGSLMICDEVMTGFRVHYGGAQRLYGIKPDITTFGKIIGGGLPVGAYGGKKEIMRHVAPDGPVYQAGTLSGNPLAMAAGLTTLKILRDNPVIYQELERRSRLLESGIKRYAHSAGIPICINRVGSMICLFFTDIDVKDYDTALTSNTKRYADYFKHMLEHGIYLPPSQFETFFVSAAHTDEDIEHTIEAMSKAFSNLAD